MRKIFLFILITIILPLTTADALTPGYSPIKITNQITNIQDYPEYKFVVLCEGPTNIGFDIGGKQNSYINYVQENGIISTPYYKYSQLSVYAIEKSKLDEKKLLELSNEEDMQKIREYLKSINAKEVINDLNHYETKHVSDPIKEENNYYEIELGNTKYEPQKTITKKNFLIYLYVLIPIICATITIYILNKRKNQND